MIGVGNQPHRRNGKRLHRDNKHRRMGDWMRDKAIAWKVRRNADTFPCEALRSVYVDFKPQQRVPTHMISAGTR